MEINNNSDTNSANILEFDSYFFERFFFSAQAQCIIVWSEMITFRWLVISKILDLSTSHFSCSVNRLETDVL